MLVIYENGSYNVWSIPKVPNVISKSRNVFPEKMVRIYLSYSVTHDLLCFSTIWTQHTYICKKRSIVNVKKNINLKNRRIEIYQKKKKNPYTQRNDGKINITDNLLNIQWDEYTSREYGVSTRLSIIFLLLLLKSTARIIHIRLKKALQRNILYCFPLVHWK